MSEGLIDDVEILVGCLSADLVLTGLHFDLGVFDLADRRWVVGAAPQTPQGFGDEGLLLVLGGGERLLSAQDDGGVDLVGIVDYVQDWVIDQLGHGWPELIGDDKAFGGVFLPELDNHGSAVWVAGNYQVPVGQLSTVAVALPPQWDGANKP